LLTTVVAVSTALGPSAAPAPVPDLREGPVFIIIGENLNYHDISERSAPYITRELRPTSAWLENFFSLGHKSLMNYVGLTSGQFTSCHEDNGSPMDCHQNVDNLFSQLRYSQNEWKQWMQSMPEPCQLTYISGSPRTLNYFSVNHSPAVYYDDIVGDFTNPSDYCKAHVVPAGTLAPGDWSTLDQALDAGQVPGFNLVIPNNCENGHNVCIEDKNGGFSRPKSVEQWDDYLSRAVPRIMNSPAFGDSGLLIVVFDEGYQSKLKTGGRIMFAALGPKIVPGTYGAKPTGNTDNPNLFSLLQMLEDGYSVPRLGAAFSAAPLPDFWKR